MAKTSAKKTRVTRKHVAEHRSKAGKDHSPSWEGCENLSAEQFYVHWFFNYISTYPMIALTGERQGVKGLGKHMMCKAIHILTRLGFYRDKISLSAGGGSVIENPDTMNLDESIQFLNGLHKDYLKHYETKARKTYRDWNSARRETIIRLAKYLKNTIRLVQYYKETYGFRVKNKKGLFQGFEPIPMHTTTQNVLKHCKES